MIEAQLWIIILHLTVITLLLIIYCITSIILKIQSKRMNEKTISETDKLIKKMYKEDLE